jgi:hypothetical protein
MSRSFVLGCLCSNEYANFRINSPVHVLRDGVRQLKRLHCVETRDNNTYDISTVVEQWTTLLSISNFIQEAKRSYFVYDFKLLSWFLISEASR